MLKDRIPSAEVGVPPNSITICLETLNPANFLLFGPNNRRNCMKSQYKQLKEYLKQFLFLKTKKAEFAVFN